MDGQDGCDGERDGIEPSRVVEKLGDSKEQSQLNRQCSAACRVDTRSWRPRNFVCVDVGPGVRRFQFPETAASLLQTPQIVISGHFDDQSVGSARVLLLAKPD
jgi:hypothetical protein